MVGTRRKTKTSAATDDDDPNAFTVVIPDDLDVDYFAENLPELNLSSPSPDAILALYQLLAAQASDIDTAQRDLDEARAEAEKKDVELDQALQDRERSTNDLESQVNGLQDELKQVKEEREHLITEQTALRTQISSLSTSQSSSSTEVDGLKHRLEDTEREKRDLVGVISRLKDESAQREEEIHTLRSNLKEARQEHQALETQVRELRSTENSTKFKVDSLNQQLALAQSETERVNEELTTKSDAFTKYRREKQAEIITLQSGLDSAIQSQNATQASLKALQSSHATQTHALTQALTKVQDLTGQLAEQEATYASEANVLRRLVSVLEEREKQAKEIVENLEQEWAGVGERADRRESGLRNEIEREKSAREDAEKRLDQMAKVLERMDRGELPVPGRAMPGTPSRHGMGDEMTDGMMGLSPTVAMASKAQRSGRTFTEVYADYVRLQEDYARKSAEYDHMDRTLAAVLAQIEERAPILSQQRLEYERLQSEASQLASQLSQALSERDGQSNLAEEAAQRLSRSTRENDLLQQQLEDLGRQIRSLLKEIGRRDDPSIPPDDSLNFDPPAAPAEDVDAVITNNLVLFTSIDGLQAQNQKLLKIVRELAKKMETEERDYKEAMEREQAEAVREAHEAMQELAAQLDTQKKSSESVIKAYVKERDALKTMLARVEKANGINGDGGDIDGDIDGGKAGHGAASGQAKELAEIQGQFEVYRTEMGVDSVRLREEAIATQREAAHLGAALAKANARIEYLNDRHRMSQDQFALHGRELDELSKRNQQLYDQWTRLDIECGRVSEDLQVANGRVEQLRNECANLRAEKKIWETVQGRLVDENRTLAMERSHLSDLMGNVQKMHNDLERSGENDRRRLESQLNLLEGQTQDLRTQLTQERDTIRHISLQKDIELKELQNRLDRSVQELSKTREGLVGAETSKKHLEERVEELSKHLQGNEEKLAVYERRPSAATTGTPSMDPEMNREQQLEAEVAELRSSIKVAEMDLAAARSHVVQFKDISQANEAALESLNGTYDEFKASTEAQIARHESEYKALQEKLDATNVELSELKKTHEESQKSHESARNAWSDDKKTLEGTILELSTSAGDRTTHEEDLRRQEERIKAAGERYTQEVVAHAESIKTIETLKKQLSTIQTAAREYQTLAETAGAKLTASEDSWKHQKEALDKEVADLSTRCQDLSSQNTLLHQHLESVSAQAARIRQTADSSVAPTGEGEAGDDPDTKLSELRSVVAYLRKEKEIVDLQLELSKQENARLKNQLEHLSQTLNETRATLSEERERAAETAASASQHAELVERINQANILRESNATLRADCEAHSKRARELDIKLKELSAQLNPAKEEARIAKAELESRDGQVKRLEDENRRWQERNTQLLSKYDRIDPAEVQSLRDDIEKLKQEKTGLSETVTERDTTIATLTTRVDALENIKTKMRDTIRQNNDTSKRIKADRDKKKEELEKKQEEVDTMTSTISALETQITELKAAQTLSGAAAGSAEAATASALSALQEERDKLLAEKSTWVSQVNSDSTSGATSDQWEAEKAELIKALDEALTKAKNAETHNDRLATSARKWKADCETAQKTLLDITKARAEDVEKAAAEQAAAVAAAVATIKTESDGGTSIAPSEDVSKKHAEELQALEQRLTAKHNEELKAAVDAARKDIPPAPATTSTVDLASALAEQEKKFQAKLAEDVAAAVDRGRMEQATKGKLKDQQLVRVQNKLKAVEQQVEQWKNSGLIPAEAPAATTTAAAAGSSTATPTKPPVASSSTVPPTPTNPSGTGLPRKPSVAGDGAGRGRGLAITRGAVRGGVPNRGRGAAPASAAAPKAANGGLSVMGAAAKRPREEVDGSAEVSLVKRLKPEGSSQAASSVPAKPPVQIRRPAPGT